MTEDGGGLWDVSELTSGDPIAISVSRQGEDVKTVRIDDHVTYIGRMAENHIVLEDPKVSRSHARIIERDGHYFLEDQESENGVFVAGARLAEPMKIAIGDEFSIGDSTLKVVEASQAAPTARVEQMESLGEEDWAMEQTISGLPPEKLQAYRERIIEESQARAKAKSEAQQGGKPPAPTPIQSQKVPEASAEGGKYPVLKFQLSVGGKTLTKEVALDQGEARSIPADMGNVMDVTLHLGKWTLKKRIKL